MDGNRKARRSAQFAAASPSSRHTRSAAKRGVRRLKPVVVEREPNQTA